MQAVIGAGERQRRELTMCHISSNMPGHFSRVEIISSTLADVMNTHGGYMLNFAGDGRKGEALLLIVADGSPRDKNSSTAPSDHIFPCSFPGGQGFWDSGVLVGENHKNSFLCKIPCNSIDAQFYKRFTHILCSQILLISPRTLPVPEGGTP